MTLGNDMKIYNVVDINWIYYTEFYSFGNLDKK